MALGLWLLKSTWICWRWLKTHIEAFKEHWLIILSFWYHLGLTGGVILDSWGGQGVALGQDTAFSPCPMTEHSSCVILNPVLPPTHGHSPSTGPGTWHPDSPSWHSQRLRGTGTNSPVKSHTTRGGLSLHIKHFPRICQEQGNRQGSVLVKLTSWWGNMISI